MNIETIVIACKLVKLRQRQARNSEGYMRARDSSSDDTVASEHRR